MSFTFTSLTQQQVTWNLTDTSGAIITGATVTATLYLNRDKFQPLVRPGTPDTIFNNIALIETPGGSGTYVGQIPATFNPLPSDSGYTTVITATLGATPLADFEEPTVVVPPQEVIDLVTLDEVKTWLGFSPTNTSCDASLQMLITSFSQYVLNRTGRASFKVVQQYSEVYDGNGNSRLFLDNTPIVSLIDVLIGLYSVPLSSGVSVPGIFIDRSKKSIVFRNSGFYLTPPLSIYPYRFMPGEGNVQVTYTAGYSAVPYDLQEIVIETVAQNYKRKDWIDLVSKQMSTPGASGTTSYRSWAMTPFAEEVIRFYSRIARPS